MTDILNSRLVPSDQAIESRVGDETVLLHLENGTYYGLDAVGTRIWEMLKEGMALLSICEAVALEYGVASEAVEADARRFLGDLKAHDILVDG